MADAAATTKEELRKKAKKQLKKSLGRKPTKEEVKAAVKALKKSLKKDTDQSSDTGAEAVAAAKPSKKSKKDKSGGKDPAERKRKRTVRSSRCASLGRRLALSVAMHSARLITGVGLGTGGVVGGCRGRPAPQPAVIAASKLSGLLPLTQDDEAGGEAKKVNGYTEHPELTAMSEADVTKYREDKCTCLRPP